MPDLAQRTVASSAIRALLGGAIDYAGLFPPAALPMRDAVRGYAEYSRGADAWALGRFVVPIARLDEFNDSAQSFLEHASTPWRLSALAGAGGASEWTKVEANQARGCVVDALELRVHTASEIVAAASMVPREVETFFEIPSPGDPTALVAAIAQVGRKAKVRTGGITPDAFPPAADLARFIAVSVRAGVPFKATAGLHHPLRAAYRLTYAADSPSGAMFGFLNLLLAAAFASSGLEARDVEDLLTEGDVAAFRFDADGVSWRGRRMSARQLATARGTVVLSFGSCSFTEPIAELEELGLL